MKTYGNSLTISKVTWEESEGKSGMKVKKIFVGVRPLDDVLKEAGETFEHLTKGKPIKQKRAIYFASLKEMRRVLTERRLEILKAIRDRKPSSVQQDKCTLVMSETILEKRMQMQDTTKDTERKQIEVLRRMGP
jgi:hypothetical protein